MTASVTYQVLGVTPTTPAAGSAGVFFNTAGNLCVVDSSGVVHLISTPAATGLTATGTDQAGALEVTSGLNVFGTVAAGTGAKLSASWVTADPCQVIYNGGANALTVYPHSGGKINQLATDAPMSLATNTSCSFYKASSTQWIGILSA